MVSRFNLDMANLSLCMGNLLLMANLFLVNLLLVNPIKLNRRTLHSQLLAILHPVILPATLLHQDKDRPLLTTRPPSHNKESQETKFEYISSY
mmetsp:Transcript_50487/g.118474  ORF Transcript_50487/g.118474 Transcript_50487/m.118474 type:complete len:93 (-) Transcript_50487:8-286(-)